ncbi:AAA family ATPase [Candidatus Poribacteria bacterium]|nr:AAA family ATPase [Candidatus Poribacteria bacterium]
MKTIAILSRKGGTGKTMLATHLSVEAERNGHTTALIDLDPQASTAKWGDQREDDTPAVIEAPASRLDHWLDFVEENGATLAVIDTLKIVKKSSFVVIPCGTSKADLEANEGIMDVVTTVNVPGRIVLNHVAANSDLDLEARKATKHYDVVCAPCQIGRRVGFIHAYNSGSVVQELEPQSKSAREIRALYRYITKQMEV